MLRSQRQADIVSWMAPGPSTSQESKRAILASIPARLRIRRDVPRETSVLPYSVSGDGAPNSQAHVSRDQGAHGGHHRPRPFPQEPTEQTTQGTDTWLTEQQHLGILSCCGGRVNLGSQFKGTVRCIDRCHSREYVTQPCVRHSHTQEAERLNAGAPPAFCFLYSSGP